MNLDDLPTGHEMNATIANKLFGWKGLTALDAEIAVKHRIMPDYSGDAGAAVKILTHFAEHGLSLLVWVDTANRYSDAVRYVACNYDGEPRYADGWERDDGDAPRAVTGVGESFAMAVCRFALKALECDVAREKLKIPAA